VKQDFLLEVGCENLPSGYLDDAIAQLQKLFTEGLPAARISFEGIRAMGTPKRLVVHVTGLAAKQDAAEERIVGPPSKIAIAPDGSFTKAAEGFARSQGMPVTSLARVETGKGEYLAVIKRIRGKPTVSILKELVPAWIQGIRMPKTMRWGSNGLRFGRPIRWLLCLYGDRVVPMKIGGLVAGRLSRHSPLFEKTVVVKSIDHYFSAMRRSGIILDPAARRDAVRTSSRECARALGGALVEDEELVSIVANLLESPVALAGGYDEAFLQLPREVIVTALKSHQRYFSVVGARGTLVPAFIAFADGARRNTKGIVKGYERVLRARLEDAVFYYREDTAKPFEEMAGKLAGIIWLEGLGSLAEKASRVEALALWMRSAWNVGGEELERSIRRAARLAKADLASEMVKDGKEFTALQGYMGREYARVSGETSEVAEAIFEHYLPRFAGDCLPRGDTSMLVALADKMDTITGCFIMGLEPSGSQDPYALRRHAMGVLRILIARKAPLSLTKSLERSVEIFRDGSGAFSRGREELLPALHEFFSQRMYTILRNDGVDHDLVAAILAAPWDYPHATEAMGIDLQSRRKRGELATFVLAMKRISNIIPRVLREGFTVDIGIKALTAFSERQVSELGIAAESFSVEAEKKLYDALSIASRKLIEAERSSEIERSLEILSALVPYVNKYFDDVLVNCEDEKIRNNRIAFLANTYRAFMLFCDFSLIAGE
jgi:glycyl-tRNA synthetase beta chain